MLLFEKANTSKTTPLAPALASPPTATLLLLQLALTVNSRVGWRTLPLAELRMTVLICAQYLHACMDRPWSIMTGQIESASISMPSNEAGL